MYKNVSKKIGTSGVKGVLFANAYNDEIFVIYIERAKIN